MVTASRREASRKQIPHPSQINKAYSPCPGSGQCPRPGPSRLKVTPMLSGQGWLLSSGLDQASQVSGRCGRGLGSQSYGIARAQGGRVEVSSVSIFEPVALRGTAMCPIGF